MKRCNFLVLFALTIFFFRNSYGQDNLTFTINGVSFDMIFVEGGTFVMGCTPEQGNCYPGERPTHKVTVNDFFMGKFQVTQELWYAVMGTTVQQQWLVQQTEYRERLRKINAAMAEMIKLGAPYQPPLTAPFDVATLSGGVLFTAEDYTELLNVVGHFPMHFINYDACELFCHRLNQLLAEQLPEGYRFRIPTEAQWEYAARGGKMSKGYRFSGSDHINEVAWYDANSDGTTHEVGKKIKNELGIYDMSGNVWEWCRDRYSENYYNSSLSINPKGPAKGKQYNKWIPYVLRGGSWDHGEWSCRAATRNKDVPLAAAENYGFRLSLEPPPKLSGSGFFGYTGNFTTSRLSSGKNLTFKVNDQKLEMVFVQGGTFAMGCSSENNTCDSVEKPVRNVTLSNFYMGKLEVTQKLWYDVMGTTVQQQRDLNSPNWGIYGEGDQYPMFYVSYEDCEAFCEKLNQLLRSQLPEDYKFTIPTEAQWEYAARGGSKSKGYIYSGDNKINKVAWWEGNSGGDTRKVGLKSKNELGIHDMSGNVWEWCRDWFEDRYYSYGATTNPQGPLSGTHRVIRGGSLAQKAWHSRVTTRWNVEPEESTGNLGFRIALQPAKDFFDVKSLKNAVRELSPRSSPNNRNFKINDVGFEMIFVKGGTFTMGCTSDPNNCFPNEEPIHSVTLSDFYVGKYQVTQQLWGKIMGTTLSQQRNLLDSTLVFYGEGDHHPMYYINYKDCEEFCEKLNQLLSKQLPKGYKFSIPTEAQWEYAARGGRKSKGYSYSGDNFIGKVAWYEEDSNDQTQEVGRKKKNELGIYDMSGNLWEWCIDWFDGDFYSYSPSIDPTGPVYGYQRVLRGGSWRSIPQACRVSCRSAGSPNERASNYGLRLVLVKE
jgi:formylglycine-generating enzyme required for sulfatase activity